MPGTGPLRRSSAPARKKAIVGKSRVEPELLQSPAFVFLLFVNGLRFQATAFSSRSSVFALEVLLTPKRRHVDTVLHLVAAPPRLYEAGCQALPPQKRFVLRFSLVFARNEPTTRTGRNFGT
jgi:hypothetical protein